METALKCPECFSVHFSGEFCTNDGTKLQPCSLYEANAPKDRDENEFIARNIVDILLEKMFDQEEYLGVMNENDFDTDSRNLMQQNYPGDLYTLLSDFEAEDFKQNQKNL
jgi:hypothetical protein